MKLTTLEDRNVFAPIPGLDTPYQGMEQSGQPCCGRSRGQNVNTNTVNPNINVTVNTDSDHATTKPHNTAPRREDAAPRRNETERSTFEPPVREIIREKAVPVKQPVIVPLDRVRTQKVYQEREKVVPLDRVQRVPSFIEKIIPLDRIKTMFTRRDVPMPVDRVQWIAPQANQKSSFEGSKK